MPKSPFHDYSCDPIPEESFDDASSGEVVYNDSEFRPSKAVKAKKAVAAAPALSSVVRPATELLRAREGAAAVPAAEVPCEHKSKGKRGRKPIGSVALTNAERKRAWRERNELTAKEKEREYLREWRAKRRAGK